MVTNTLIAGTPYYVLMDGNCRIGPRVVRSHAATECSAIYGFADKGPYDKFCMNSGLALKPYPLVQGYLRNQLSALDGKLKLVVVNAAGPSDPLLLAATVETVLEAHEMRMIELTVAYRLVWDQEMGGYRVEDASA